jgi:hypothetical protein
MHIFINSSLQQLVHSFFYPEKFTSVHSLLLFLIPAAEGVVPQGGTAFGCVPPGGWSLLLSGLAK